MMVQGTLQTVLFKQGSSTGTGSFVVYNASGGSAGITNLLPNHSYTASVYEYNGSGSGSDYLTSPLLTNSFTTPCPSYNNLHIDSSGSLNICSGDSVILTGPSGFVSYLWSNGSNTKQVTVNTAGTYSVTATDSNGCQGTVPSVTVTIKPLLGTLGAIKGQAGNFCGGATNVIFSIDTVENATSYVWKVPNKCTIVSGQGTTSININIASGFTSGYITVRALNSCGSSFTDSLKITAKPAALSKNLWS